ncbi:MAG TPA: hypothetical protein VM241_01835 [Candidatus Thermoplasmatota archaeon]|nr:hypothetical protein [Candidatus Thermoplasmatota archaeon]
MTVRRMQALDVPAAELERMKQALSPRYGSELWDPDGQALLVVRVPRDEPDLVNDLEGAVDYLSPGDVLAAKVTLFVGHQRSHIIPTPTLQGLMEARAALDRAQADAARRALKPGEHQVSQAPSDPRRLHRLLLRLPIAKVADVTEAHLAPFVSALGPLLRTPPLSQVRAVQLVADRDDVRLDADLFFQDLEERWHEERQRHELAQALAAQQAAATEAAAAAATAQNLLPRAPLAPQPAAPRTAVAPLRRPDQGGSWDATQAVPLPPLSLPEPPADGMGEVFEVGEPLPMARPGGAAPRGATAVQSPPIAPAPNPALAGLDARLKALGFTTLPSPGRHGIDLAAERADGFPNRVIAFLPPVLDAATADRVLAVARTVGVDQALVVCAQADPEARRRLIATKAKWLTAAEIPLLDL